MKVSDQEFERRLRNKDLSKGGAPETSGLLRKKDPGSQSYTDVSAESVCMKSLTGMQSVAGRPGLFFLKGNL